MEALLLVLVALTHGACGWIGFVVGAQHGPRAEPCLCTRCRVWVEPDGTPPQEQEFCGPDGEGWCQGDHADYQRAWNRLVLLRGLLLVAAVAGLGWWLGRGPCR